MSWSAYVSVLVVASASCLAVGGWLSQRGRHLPVAERVILVGLPVLILLAAALSLDPILTAPAANWNDLRLAPAAALARGYGLYYLPGDGPMLGHLYGPIPPIVYAPVTLLPTPSTAIRAGVVLTLVLYLLPAGLLLKTLAGPRRVLAAGCFLLFTLFVFRSDVVRGAAFFIHADTPALAFAGLACLPLVDPDRRREWGWLGLSAAAAVLSAGSKQVMLPVLFALPVYLWVADGWKAGWRYLKMVVGMGVVATALVAALTDVPAMLYQTLVVPSGHPIRGGVWLPGFVQVLRDVVPRASGFGVVIVLYGLYRARCADGWVSLRQWARDNPWLVPVFVGVFLIPTSILGRMKVGGGMGALVYAVYFLFVGALLAVVHAGRQEGRVGPLPLQAIASGLVIGALAVVAVDVAPGLGRLPSIVEDLPRDVEASAYEFVRAHPGQVYLPYNPLVTLFAEDRAYHMLLPTISGQYFERLAGASTLAVSQEDDRAFLEHVPGDLRYVLVREEGGSPMTERAIHAGFEGFLGRYLPQFRATVVIAPGWVALVPEARSDGTR